MPAIAAPPQTAAPAAKPSRNLLAACLAHALHDGYTDGLYAFLPIWQAQFGLSYAGLAMVRALYSGTMGGLQLPAERLLKGVSARSALLLATLIAAAGFLVMALPLGFAGLCLGLVMAGIGSSIQHPRGSSLVHETYPAGSRRPLGIYNFSGDLGKASLPALAALLLPLVAWRPVMGLMAVLGLVVSGLLYGLAPATRPAPSHKASRATGGARSLTGFTLLTAIGGFDTAIRMGYLLFLPFLVHQRGGGSAMVGLALALLFIGGAFGKATCGWLGERVGVTGTVVLTETATALLILATLATPLMPMLVVLPLLGVVLNGTSSVLYGTVPELAPGGDHGKAFAIFYTSVTGSGGLAPILYGAIADHSSQTTGIMATAMTAALIVPLVLALKPFLQAGKERQAA
ncbi:MFS transporter [Novosphingobium terrae]|uniref:MFS transporter n=1 Tax=Novosphingobium terrae TaxID=2726189 RepID=UPI00197CD06D|nr:MFS transporter [Novosphingobium terrae]